LHGNTIRQVFGVPPEMLGIVEPGSARATIDIGEYIYEKHVIQPRREFLRAVLQERLVPEYDERLILDFESTVDEDRQFLKETAAAAPFALSVDEWRDLLGREALLNGEGQVYMVPKTLQ